jgi:uncharacterized protein
MDAMGVPRRSQLSSIKELGAIGCAMLRRNSAQSAKIVHVRYEWDPSKATTNLEKHDVDFEEAITVFDNPLAVIFDDPLHSVGELREIIIGHSDQNQLLLVSFTERPNAIRIISARPVTSQEGQDYERRFF